jgi:hypothetical protein
MSRQGAFGVAGGGVPQSYRAAAAWLQFTRRGPTVVDVSASSWLAIGGKFEFTIKKAELGQGKVPVLYEICSDGSLRAAIPDFLMNAAGDMVISVDVVFDARIAVA